MFYCPVQKINVFYEKKYRAICFEECFKARELTVEKITERMEARISLTDAQEDPKYASSTGRMTIVHLERFSAVVSNIV